MKAVAPRFGDFGGPTKSRSNEITNHQITKFNRDRVCPLPIVRPLAFSPEAGASEKGKGANDGEWGLPGFGDFRTLIFLGSVPVFRVLLYSLLQMCL